MTIPCSPASAHAGSDPSADFRRAVAALEADGVATLCGGDTAARWLTLYGLARSGPVGLARLVEAHLDATSILADAKVPAVHGALYGVWASEGAGAELRFDDTTSTVTGAKPFCSGIGLVDRALVTAIAPSGPILVEVDIESTAAAGQSTADLDAWRSPALSDTRTGPVTFDKAAVDRVVGSPGSYLSRPRFWHHAVGPAACWAGAAAGLVDHAENAGPDNEPFHRAARGDLMAQRYNLETLLVAAGDASDRAPDDAVGARRRATATRHLIERGATHIADRFSRAFGPRPFVTDRELSVRHADLHLYLRQHHDERSLADLAGLSASSARS